MIPALFIKVQRDKNDDLRRHRFGIVRIPLNHPRGDDAAERRDVKARQVSLDTFFSLLRRTRLARYGIALDFRAPGRTLRSRHVEHHLANGMGGRGFYHALAGILLMTEKIILLGIDNFIDDIWFFTYSVICDGLVCRSHLNGSYRDTLSYRRSGHRGLVPFPVIPQDADFLARQFDPDPSAETEPSHIPVNTFRAHVIPEFTDDDIRRFDNCVFDGNDGIHLMAVVGKSVIFVSAVRILLVPLCRITRIRLREPAVDRRGRRNDLHDAAGLINITDYLV